MIISNPKQRYGVPTACCIYIIASYVSAYLCVIFDWPVGFMYHSRFSSSEVINFIWLPLSQIILIWLGVNASYHTRHHYIQFRFRRFQWYSPWIILTAITLFTAYCAYLGFVLKRDVNTSGEIDRVLESKGSQFLLIISTLLAIINLHKNRLGVISISLAITSGAMFAIFDGSRSSVIPPVLLSIYCFASGRKKMMTASILAVILILATIQVGRAVSRSYHFEVNSQVLYSFGSININYFLGFSYLHLMAAEQDFSREFGGLDILYSIIPLPSFMMPFSADPSEWRLDTYRPLGAQAGLLHYSFITFSLFNIAIGFFGHRAIYLESAPIRAVVSMLLLLCFAASFQYNLRSIQWFLWISIFIMALSPRCSVPASGGSDRG